MKLIIVESPHKATTIGKYLGKDFKVIASKGHVRDLPANRTAVDIKNNFTPEYEISPDKQAIINHIKEEVKKADSTYLAGDPDREGEAISWHIAEVCGIKGDDIRIEFNEISKKAVEKAIQNPRAINMDLVNAQQARRVLDRIVGYELSPIISWKITKGLSAGRVQSVALKMIVDRENLIRNFKPEEYWNISAHITKTTASKSYKCDFVSLNGKKTKINNKEKADFVLEKAKGAKWSVEAVKRSESFTKAPPPFTTSTMQQEAIRALGFDAAQVTKYAQSLYEGIDIPEKGQIAFVTYIRTDSVRVSSDAQYAALNMIKDVFGEDYAPKYPNKYETKDSAQDAHEAIRPININLTPEKLKPLMSKNINEWKLYNLIYNRFLASQMAPARYDTLDVSILADSADAKLGFKLKGKTCKFKGFTAVYDMGTEEKDETKTLPNFQEGEELVFKDIKADQKFTKPDPRFTDGTIIKAMEDNGIGRPSTYEKTVSTLIFRKYVEKKKGAESKKMELVPTELGEKVCEELVEDFPKIMDVKFTANMEKELDTVAEGKLEWTKLLSNFYPSFHETVEMAKMKGKDPTKQVSLEVSNVKCDKCGAMMVVRQGKFGKFLACPNYPSCKNTKPMPSNDNSQDYGKCPHCGRAMIKRTSKANKPYYTCSGYPDCKFISWDIPAPILCPKCKNAMRIVKSKDGSIKYVCSDAKCGNVVAAKE